MKELNLIAIVFASCLILIPDISIATGYASESKDYQDTIIPGVTGDILGTDMVDTSTKVFPANMEKDYSNKYGTFRKGLSYSGSCDILPKTTACLIYSDNYKWVVSDIRIDSVPIFVGVRNYKSVELIRCYGADYYHILGTPLVMSIPRQEERML
jgi:hypothetical protein